VSSFLNYIKCERILKTMKLIELSKLKKYQARCHVRCSQTRTSPHVRGRSSGEMQISLEAEARARRKSRVRPWLGRDVSLIRGQGSSESGALPCLIGLVVGPRWSYLDVTRWVWILSFLCVLTGYPCLWYLPNVTYVCHTCPRLVKGQTQWGGWMTRLKRFCLVNYRQTE
jgi:hypothetical protein